MWIITMCVFILGLFIGSFYNVVALRTSKNESIMFPASHCPNCNHRLAWYELIPVFSYLGLRGKCLKCKKHISIQYPIGELTTAILFAFSFYKYGFNYMTLISIILVSLSVITFITDVKFMIILDEVLLVSLIPMLIIFFICEGLKATLIRILHGFILFGIMLLIKIIGDKVFKKESLGWGDIKLSFFSGLLLGPVIGVSYIFIGAFLALPYALVSMKKDHVIPFGPFLVLSLLILFWNIPFALKVVEFLFGGAL